MIMGGVILGLPLTMLTPPDNKQSLRKQLKQKLHSAFSVKSRNLDVLDAGPTSTSTIATPHLVSPTLNSRVDLAQETLIVHPPSTVQGLTGIGGLISYAWYLNQALNPLQIMDLMWAQLHLQALHLSKMFKEILHRKEVCATSLQLTQALKWLPSSHIQHCPTN